MQRSTNRMLTTHVGSLPRPDDLIQLYRDNASSETLAACLTSAVAEVVRHQQDVGLDIVNDGEFGKATRAAVDYGAWWSYVYDRLEGFEVRTGPPIGGFGPVHSKDRANFGEFYDTGMAMAGGGSTPAAQATAALVDLYDWWYSSQDDLAGFRKWAAFQVEVVNHALKGIPADRVRFHICWGSWHGPHSSDVALKDIADLLIRVNAQAYSVEAGNVRHAHEWKVWRDVVKLPPGRILIPGVVSHATNVLEHPELVADRLLRYAGVVGRENVIAGTDCGLGGRIHPQLAWAKLRILVEGAALASQQLWAS